MFSGHHISIEGMDGVGKSTICELLVKKTGFEFVEKPLRFLFDEDGDYSDYIRIRDYVNSRDDRVFTSWFYGLAATFLYDRYSGHNIITDRHLVSNFIWSGEPESYAVFDTLVEKLGHPDLTVILRASETTVKKRLMSRNPNDSDLDKISKTETVYDKVNLFFERYPMPHLIIDVDDLAPEEICGKILKELDSLGIKYV